MKEFRRRRTNPYGLTESQVLMDAAIKNPTNHLFAAWNFSAMGTHRRGRAEVAAEATIAVANKAAKNKEAATGLARTALVDNKFTIADITFKSKDKQQTQGTVDVVISPLPKV